MTVQGLDVSGYQSATFSVSGQSFVIVKATEGTSYVNPRYAAQVAHARSHGVVVGHYHFQHHGNAVAEFEYFAKHADVRSGDIIALDWEQKGDSTADKDAWLRAAKAHYPHNKVLLYTYTSMWRGVDTSGYVADGLWIADPNHAAGHPAVTHSWVFHQYSTAGGIDHSIGNFADAAALEMWTKSLAPVAPAPKPKPPAHAPRPKVSLSHVISAARTDPHAKQGHAAHAADVKPVEAALHAEGFLPKAYDADGSFGSLTVEAYAKWQRKCGYSGAAANGIPGHASLSKLGAAHGFEVVS